MRVIASSDEDTIALPPQLLATLELQEGEEVTILVAARSVYLINPNSILGNVQGIEEDNAASVIDDGSRLSLEELVAQIKQTPYNPRLVHQPTKTVDELLAELEANPPAESPYTPEEWDRLWAEFEQQTKVMNHAHDMVEGHF